MASNRLAKGLTPLKWVTTPAIGQGRSSGGSTAAELFESGSSQRRRPHIETLVREICQNSIDQRIGEGKAKVFFDLILLTGKEKDNFLQIEMENGNIKEESFYMSGDTLIIQSISNGIVKKNKFIKESLVL